MPNICNFMLKAKSDELENIKRFISVLSHDVDKEKEEAEEDNCLAGYRFSRVWIDDCGWIEVDEENKSVEVYGECAWSVYSCMFEGEYTYYNQWKQYEEEKVTSILIVSKLLNLTVEIFSEETGMCFEEHFIVENGEILVDECLELIIDEEEGDEDDPVYISPLEWDFTI